MSKVKLNEDFYYFDCPHCSSEIAVHIKDLNCQIFRHAIFKDTYRQVDPHLCKEECDKLVRDDKVFGCCLPFEISRQHKGLIALKCTYK